MDLVDGNTTVETVLHLTVPAGSVDGGSADSSGSEDSRASEDSNASEDSCESRDVTGSETDEFVTDGATSSQSPAAATSSQSPAAGASAQSPAAATSSQSPAAATSAQDRPGLTVGSAGETFVGASGPMGSDLSWFPLSSLATATCAPTSDARRCDPATGALLDVGDRLGTTSYRPGVVLQAFVRRRDGRCRFPGCSVAARQCDLDHVVPWPRGSTTATNLMCLCRRHHRVKQRRRWRVRLRDDGTAEWTDPRGTVVLTEPVDHLGATQTRTVDVLPVSEATCSRAEGEDPRTETGWERGWVGAGELNDLSADQLRSTAEQIMAIALEHILKADSLDTDAHGIDDRGRGGRSRHRTGPATPASTVGAITTEEIDELARLVRRGRFATIDEAAEARNEALHLESAEACRDTVGHRPRRVDFGFVGVHQVGGADVGDLVDVIDVVDDVAVAVAVDPDIAADIASDGGHDTARASGHPVVVFDPEVERPCSPVNRAAAASAEPPPF